LQKADVAVVGAGILGLAHAYVLARRGRSVVVFERSLQAAGASVRNFGMIWPIGQPAGRMHAMALRSRDIWLEVLEAAGLPYFPTGSLHVVYREDEAAVAQEFCAVGPAQGYECRWLDRDAALARSIAIRPAGLIGAIWSPGEVTVDPRVTLAKLPLFLAEKWGVGFRMRMAAHGIDLPVIEAGDEKWEVESALVCSGADFETLYPEIFRDSGLTRCKLQMMRTRPQPEGWQLGPALAAGLTLRFYPSFELCHTLGAFKQRIAAETPDYDRWGIHVLVSQTAGGELTIGDSHQYGSAVDPFDRTEIDDLILRYARGFLQAPELEIAQRWHGVYAKHSEQPFLSLSPAAGVHVIAAPGGSGMTLSFGLAERTVQEMGF
jgi:FAD dependent oxidoreductase TIGR03364